MMREQKSQWNVAFSPPEVDEHVLAYFESGGLSGYSIAFYDGKGDWYEIHGDRCAACDAGPTHWMELPEEPLIPRERVNE